jgi:putative ABC transport system permease protein
MFFKIVKNDFKRKKVITVAVSVFITMAVILGASATNIIANLIQSMSQLQERAVPADIAQMHSGKYVQAEIDKFTDEKSANIAMQETMFLQNFDGMNIHFGEDETMAGTVQDI